MGPLWELDGQESIYNFPLSSMGPLWELDGQENIYNIPLSSMGPLWEARLAAISGGYSLAVCKFLRYTACLAISLGEWWCGLFCYSITGLFVQVWF
jgi:hypothetical protein